MQQNVEANQPVSDYCTGSEYDRSSTLQEKEVNQKNNSEMSTN